MPNSQELIRQNSNVGTPKHRVCYRWISNKNQTATALLHKNISLQKITQHKILKQSSKIRMIDKVGTNKHRALYLTYLQADRYCIMQLYRL